ncbi:MAG: DUF6314 family protein [Pseudomonadota bacterium]
MPTAAFLAGLWAITRVIRNVPEGVIGELWGEAVFVPAAAVPATDRPASGTPTRRAPTNATATGATATGAAGAAATGATLACRESGVLRFRGADYHAARVSLWRFPAPGRVEVMFEDGRPFHGFETDDPVAEHRCGADLYRVAYAFRETGWTSHWDVDGPQKSYEMITHYRRPGVADGRPLDGWPVFQRP